MDRYVIKLPKGQKPKDHMKTSGKNMRQATIESLQGVVVVEDVLRHKSILKVENQTKDNLMASLTQLSKKTPSRQVLQSTKIGHTINRLTKHTDVEVAALAGSIVSKWKTHFKEKMDKPMMEVKCDAKTEALRQKGRSMLADAMGLREKHILAEAVERETFHQCKRLATHPYRRTMRNLVFTLKHQADVRTKLVNQQVEVKDFVSKYLKTGS